MRGAGLRIRSVVALAGELLLNGNRSTEFARSLDGPPGTRCGQTSIDRPSRPVRSAPRRSTAHCTLTRPERNGRENRHHAALGLSISTQFVN